jgi:cell cycle serine/threonine-protein kinase CDC5/MSD2
MTGLAHPFPTARHVDYVCSRRQGSIFVRDHFTVDQYPEEAKPKVYLLRHFESYMMSRLSHDNGFTFQDLDRTKGMDFVQMYLRMKHVILFQLSNGVFQVRT